VGSLGAAAFFSYEWGKPVVAGVGGAAVVNEAGLATRMREQYGSFAEPPLRRELVMSLQYLAHRAVSRTGLFWHVRGVYRGLSRAGLLVGSYGDPRENPEYGWRMTRTVRRRLAGREAWAREQLDWRRAAADRYLAGLGGLGFPRPAAPQDSEAVLARIPVPVSAKERVLASAARHGVEMGDWYGTPVHPLADDELATVGYRPGSCPNAEWAAAHVVTLPVRGSTRMDDVDRALDLLARLKASGDA
jgi:perosamine synthetase